MNEPRRKISLRLPPDLIDAGREWASEAHISLTDLIEDSLRKQLGISPESVEFRRMQDLRGRLDVIERWIEAMEREGAT